MCNEGSEDGLEEYKKRVDRIIERERDVLDRLADEPEDDEPEK